MIRGFGKLGKGNRGGRLRFRWRWRLREEFWGVGKRGAFGRRGDKGREEEGDREWRGNLGRSWRGGCVRREKKHSNGEGKENAYTEGGGGDRREWGGE